MQDLRIGCLRRHMTTPYVHEYKPVQIQYELTNPPAASTTGYDTMRGCRVVRMARCPRSDDATVRPYLWNFDVGIYNYVSTHVLRSCGQDGKDEYEACGIG